MFALDFAANRETALSDDLVNYRIVHFATHGYLDAKNPKFSGLLLSLCDERGSPRLGFISTPKVFGMKLNADLVVLSACQTGLGREVRGEGLVGLTRAFMYAGSPRVVVSLWKVDDRATSELMKSFYAEMLKSGKTPAAALRAAQIATWQHDGWRAPFYWAPFVLQGDWR
jgi:CHAT domain-containing protein